MAKLIKASADGINDLLRNIEVTVDKVVTAQASGMAQVCIDIANHAKENHPFKNQTYNLENSIQPEPVIIEGDLLIGPVRAGMDYAAPVEFGVPGRSAPYPYMQPAAEANKQNLVDTMAAVTERAQQSVKVTK